MMTRQIKYLARAATRIVALPALGVVTGLVAAVVTTALITPRYEATASVIVLPKATEGTDVVNLGDVSLAQNLVFSVAQLAESREVAVAVATSLGVPVGDVVGHIHGTAQLGIQIVTVEASARTAARSAAMADAATTAMADVAAQLKLGGSTVGVEPLDTAGVPGSPASPRPLLNYALGALAGVLVGVGALSLRTRAGDRFRRVHEIEEELGLPALGVIGMRMPRTPKQPAAALYARHEIGASVDGLVSALSVLMPKREGRRLLVTSVSGEESSAFVASVLAVAMTHPEHGTILLEGTPSAAVIDGYFPGQLAHSVQDAIADREPIEPVDASTSLTVLTFESVTQHFASTPTFDDLGELVDQLAARSADVVLVAPVVLAGRGLAELARHVDAVIVVIDSDRVRRADAGRASLIVQRLGVSLVGAVVTGSAAHEDGWQPLAWPAQPPNRDGVPGTSLRRASGLALANDDDSAAGSGPAALAPHHARSRRGTR